MEQVHVRKTWITVSNIICFSNTAFGVANSVEQQLQGWGFFVSMTSHEHSAVEQVLFDKVVSQEVVSHCDKFNMF